MTRTSIHQRWLWIVLLLAGLQGLSPVQAQPIVSDDALWISGFEGQIIPAQFPLVDGVFQLPDYSVANQLEWVIAELAVGENTTLAEVNQRFSPAFDAQAIADFFNNNLRVNFPDAAIIDVIGMTPVGAVVIIDGTSGGPPESGFLQINSLYSGSQEITFLQVQNFFGTIQFPDDQVLELEAAMDKFDNFHPANGLFVGYIDLNGQCQPITSRNSTIPRALGSIFKMWVLGGVAEDIAIFSTDTDDPIELVAAERASGGTINNEPLGTIFTVQDMATLMMGISDNTATDHLHELVGRTAIGQVVQDYGVAEPDILLPFLNISEQFHVFSRFALPTALTYVNGTEPFQEQFLTNQIEPLGPSFPTNFPFLHQQLLTDGTWAASARDICQTLAGLHATAETNGALELVDIAMASQAAFPNVRSDWDRVWYKGGSLASNANGLHVLANAWLLENSGDFPPYVVVGLANNPAGGIDAFEINSVLARIIELVRAFEP
ncbi:MAG: serine hydrolase [Pseudomonadota bacterium]